jgi:hypothetical protein
MVCSWACSNQDARVRGPSHPAIDASDRQDAYLADAAHDALQGHVGAGDADGGISCAGIACAGACSDGRCLVRLAQPSSPAALVIDGTNAYFASCSRDGTASMAMSVPLDGGSTTTFATGPSCPVSLAIGDRSLYVAGLDRGDIIEVPLGGGTSLTVTSGADGATGIALDATNIYWATKSGAVIKAQLHGDMPTTLASSQNVSSRPLVDATHVYWGDPEDRTIKKVPLAGGSPTISTSAPDVVTALAMAGEDVYFAAGYVLMKAPLGGGAPTTLGTAAGAPIAAVAVDDTHVYFTSYDTIWKVPQAGGTPTLLASHQGMPNAIAVDATSVYWTNADDWPARSSGGEVMKLSPK